MTVDPIDHARAAADLPGGLLVMRNDGLGARLMPLLNALRLAKLLDIPVYMYWPMYLLGHNTTEVALLFSDDFRTKHLIPPQTYQALRAGRTVRAETEIATLGGADLQAAAAAGDFFLFDNTEHDVALLGEDALDVQVALSGTLDDAMFTDTVAGQMAQIRDRLAASPPLVYHLRQGDLTHSYKTRAGEWTNKYIPNEVYLAHMATNGIGPDQPAVLIGDTISAIDWIIDRQPGVSRIDHMLDRDALSSLQFDFLELYTMSRARKLVAPEHSGFSKMAARIGHIPVEDVKNSLPDDVRATALADLEQRLWHDRASFANDGDVAQSLLHLRAPKAEHPNAAIDGLVRRELASGSTVPFLFRYAAEAAAQSGDIAGLRQTAAQAHGAMLADPRTLSATNAMAATGLVAAGAVDEARKHLRRAAYMMPNVPQMTAALHAYLSHSPDANLHPDFFPTGFNADILRADAVWRVVLLQGFAWEAWPFLQDRFKNMLANGHGHKTFLAHTRNLITHFTKEGNTTAATNMTGLSRLVAFYLGETAALADLAALAEASDPTTDPIPLQRHTLALLTTDDKAAARAGLEALITAQPDMRCYHALMGQLSFIEKDFPRSLAHYDITNPVKKSGRADFIRFAGQHVRLLDRARRSDEADALFCDLMSETAWSDQHMSNYTRRPLTADQAAKLTSRLIAAAPEMEKARPTHAQLGTLYAGQGDHAAATAHFQKALAFQQFPPALLHVAIKMAEASGDTDLATACTAMLPAK